jgi:hypothetical protein
MWIHIRIVYYLCIMCACVYLILHQGDRHSVCVCLKITSLYTQTQHKTVGGGAETRQVFIHTQLRIVVKVVHYSTASACVVCG